MSSKAAPSPTQLEALQRVVEHGGRLQRLRGGYWTWPGCPFKVRPDAAAGDAPEWSTGTRTVRALEVRGWVARAGVHAEEWKDDRMVTPAGREFVASAPAIAAQVARVYLSAAMLWNTFLDPSTMLSSDPGAAAAALKLLPVPPTLGDIQVGNVRAVLAAAERLTAVADALVAGVDQVEARLRAAEPSAEEHQRVEVPHVD